MWTTARRSRFGPEGENSSIFEDPYILTSSADGDGRRASPTTWTVPMKRAMLEALVAGAREGKRDGNGFKKEVFKSAVDEVNKLYCSVSPGGSEKIPLAVGRIKYKIKVKYRGAKDFRYYTLRHYEKLELLYAGRLAPEELALPPGDSKRETAVERVQKHYHHWDAHRMIAAMSIFSDEAKAQMFCGMKPGATRDAWINREIKFYENDFQP
ncbi:uncharacterized protein LAJ45_03713 [Morchella importuna]|uniref:uncharacterized protein n=1 Tax=Morchella importuna TaxID=1174673 RepID=UPI001E8EC4D9|nr:uncharacterized protein LAJ45_03713 [Morchella importuna]KAH8152286.1 hypothetical protein LAJ45_03713 [Morchella importuna]